MNQLQEIINQIGTIHEPEVLATPKVLWAYKSLMPADMKQWFEGQWLDSQPISQSAALGFIRWITGNKVKQMKIDLKRVKLLRDCRKSTHLKAIELAVPEMEQMVSTPYRFIIGDFLENSPMRKETLGRISDTIKKDRERVALAIIDLSADGELTFDDINWLNAYFRPVPEVTQLVLLTD